MVCVREYQRQRYLIYVQGMAWHTKECMTFNSVKYLSASCAKKESTCSACDMFILFSGHPGFVSFYSTNIRKWLQPQHSCKSNVSDINDMDNNTFNQKIPGVLCILFTIVPVLQQILASIYTQAASLNSNHMRKPSQNQGLVLHKNYVCLCW